jgi:hypothetical protein
LEASVDIHRIARKVESRFLAYLNTVSFAEARAQVTYSASYMDHWVIRIRLIQKIEDKLIKKQRGLQDFVDSAALKHMFVGGVDKIVSAHVATRRELVYNKATEQFVEETIPYVWTRGTNMRGCMAHAMINPLKVLSNCVQDTRRCLGTLAACNTFYCEMKSVMGNKVKERHVFLLAQSILINGSMCGVNRHGLKKSGTPIAQACFENGCKVVLNLSHTNAKDMCKDDASAVLLGRRSRAGTGIVQLFEEEKEKKEIAIKRPLHHFARFSTRNTLCFAALVQHVKAKCRTEKRRAQQKETDDEPLQQDIMAQTVIDELGLELEEEVEEFEDEPATKQSRIEQPDVVSSPAYSPSSPAYAPAYSPSSPAYAPAYSPSSPAYDSAYSPSSPAYAPTLPVSDEEDDEEEEDYGSTLYDGKGNNEEEPYMPYSEDSDDSL